MGNRGSTISEDRKVVIGKYDEKAYPDNRVISYKYTPWNFLFKNLYEQLRRIANFYFLCMGIIAALLPDSPVGAWATLYPLALVMTVSAVKQGYEDFLRHKADSEINNSTVTVVRNGVAQEIRCKKVCVGDIVRVRQDEDIPCDMVMLISSHPDSKGYVTTANLDGETNLKTLECPLDTDLTVDHLPKLSGTIACEPPTVDLYQFHGKISLYLDEGEGDEEALNPVFEKESVKMEKLHGDSCRGRHRCSFSKLHFLAQREYSAPLTADNLLLRGSRLRNTEFVYGCAVYTGQQTKLALNSTLTINKFSIVERSINTILFFFFVFLFCEVMLSVGLTFYREKDKANWWYLGGKSTLDLQLFINDFFVYVVLYYYIIPISLYVTIEFERFCGTFFFGWDLDMFCEDHPAISNTSDLNEEFGQIQYLFSDKTGTLTENRMKFRRCSIEGSLYLESNNQLLLLPPCGSSLLAIKMHDWPPEVELFLLSMALCHSVQTVGELEGLKQTSYSDKPIEYQASSPDEKALVEAAARCGVIFLGSEGGFLSVSIRGQLKKYKKLQSLEFTSERKRMSVVVSDASDRVWLFAKGAEVTMMHLMTSGHKEETTRHFNDFSMRGLRTLVLGYRQMETAEYLTLARELRAARSLLDVQARETKLSEVFDSFEEGLHLQGATAVEDRLQERVPETLEMMRVAGIKVWVLTGDKVETALNISYSCGHFKQGTRRLDLVGHTNETECLNALQELRYIMERESLAQYGLVVDGSSLKLALIHDQVLLREVALNCSSVLCCRLSPKQKAEVVRMVKRSKGRPRVAAVGDGANDVSMIQEANLGLGIMGKEGRQAVRCSDFAFAKFHCLAKALLVHGQWYYLRAATMVQYFFYKNVVFITPQVYFSILNCDSQQSIYHSVFLALYNTIFSASPIMIYSLFEQNYSAKVLLSKPELYKVHRINWLMSWVHFAEWTALGIWHSLVVYFVPTLTLSYNPVILHNNTPLELTAFGLTILQNVILVVNLKILLYSNYWTILFMLAVFPTILVYISFCWIYNALPTTDTDDNMFTVYYHLMISPSFWLISLLCVVLCLLPDVIVSVFHNQKFKRLSLPSLSWIPTRLSSFSWIPTRRKGIFILPNLYAKSS